MKILMICDFYAENQLYQDYMVAKHYVKMGHEVVVITSLYDNIFDLLNNVKLKDNLQKIKFSNAGVKIYQLPYFVNILNKIKKFASIFEILKTENPALIFSHGLNHNLNDVAKYRKFNKESRHIMDFHADYTNSANNFISLVVLNKFFRAKYLSFFYKTVDQFYAITPNVKIFVTEVYQVPADKIDVIPLGYDRAIADVHKYKSDKEVLKSRFKINSDDFVIVTGGKFGRLKRTEVLINAIKILNKENIKLFIFGKSEIFNDEYENELKSLAQDLNIIFLGWIDVTSTLDLLSVADLAVYPSSQSVLWQQSIGMDLPLIVGDSGKQDVSYLNRNKNIVMVNSENINSVFFANEIEKLYKNPQILQEMKAGAKKTAEEYLDYEQICLKTLSVFKQIKK